MFGVSKSFRQLKIILKIPKLNLKYNLFFKCFTNSCKAIVEKNNQLSDLHLVYSCKWKF